MLAVNAARQASSPTAVRVREGDPPCFVNNDAERMAVIFTSAPKSKKTLARAFGSFNASVAAIYEGQKLW